jgi:calcineurin-like phosphoesterase family protein
MHENIIKYCNRPFKDVYKMNDAIIRNHNARVTPEDTVFFIGDFCFRDKDKINAEYWLKQLNGHFVFIQGNHDHNNGTKSILLNAVIEAGGMEIYLVHNPAQCQLMYKLNLVGHVHGAWKYKVQGKTILINVGCDVHNYYPINLEEVLALYETIKRTTDKKKSKTKAL